MQRLFLPRHVMDGSLFLPSDTYLASSKAGSLPFLVLSLFTSVSKKNNTSLLLAFLTKEKCLQPISSLALSLIILSFISENCFSSILSMHWNRWSLANIPYYDLFFTELRKYSICISVSEVTQYKYKKKECY